MGDGKACLVPTERCASGRTLALRCAGLGLGGGAFLSGDPLVLERTSLPLMKPSVPRSSGLSDFVVETDVVEIDRLRLGRGGGCRIVSLDETLSESIDDAVVGTGNRKRRKSSSTSEATNEGEGVAIQAGHSPYVSIEGPLILFQ